MTFTTVILVSLVLAEWTNAVVVGDEYQYKFENILITRPTADEPKRESVSVELASKYLDDGTAAWNGERKCVSCHTNGTYLSIRPSLTPTLGAPAPAAREFFVATLQSLKAEPIEKLKQSTRPAQVIYLAAGLAEWDAHVAQALSPETDDALKLMFQIQNEDGTWGSLDCWPPFESDAFHEATVAAMAAATAPGWMEKTSGSDDQALLSAVDRLRTYLRTEAPKHDYSRTLLLWASTRMRDLISDEQRQELIAMLNKHQKEDGSWSIRTFAAPEAWGGGNRAEKLKAESDFANPEGDGHMTGLAIVVLRESGVEATDAQVVRGINWLKANQRESGRWWTRSLNTDSWHFITYSGTAYSLLALQMCNAATVAGITEPGRTELNALPSVR